MPSSLFKSTLNSRWVFLENHRFIRSDVPSGLTEDETAFLLDRGIKTIIDLRTPEEQESRPCCLMNDPRFRYLSLPVSGGFTVPSSSDQVSQSYLAMCDCQMERIVNTILDSESGVLYFCNAGKDRTGVVTALLMRQLGRSDWEIIDDYLMSGENLEPLLKKYADEHPEISPEVIMPCERYMKEFLEQYQG